MTCKHLSGRKKNFHKSVHAQLAQLVLKDLKILIDKYVLKMIKLAVIEILIVCLFNSSYRYIYCLENHFTITNYCIIHNM